MKEWIQRIAYVVLGILLTICVMLVVNKFKDVKAEKPVTSEPTAQAQITEINPMEKESITNQKEEDNLQTVNKSKSSTKEVSVSVNGIPGSKIQWIEDYPKITAKQLLEDKQLECSSYDATIATNEYDKQVIADSNVDFSNIKIAVMGDSICAAANLSENEQKKYNIPTLLQKILGAKEVYNYAIGGSTISSAANSYAMVDRWHDLPEDCDIIIVFGGTNDCLFENKWQYGNLEYENRMVEDTFCGDLDSMVSGMKYTFHEHNDYGYTKLMFVNPPSTILNDSVYNTDPGNMIHQSEFAAAIREIAPNYDFDLIDMYNDNLFNTHDDAIVSNFMPDGVHANPIGYQMIAEHIASEILQRIEQ